MVVVAREEERVAVTGLAKLVTRQVGIEETTHHQKSKLLILCQVMSFAF